MESFSAADEVEPAVRHPGSFKLQVIGSGGALIREDMEIEGSRVVLTATVGSVVTAFERRINSAGVVRYRTAHGWLSEHRRDNYRSPIVEIIDLLPSTTPSTPSLGSDSIEILTLRESTCLAITRTHHVLRQVSVFLSRAVSNDSIGMRSSATPTQSNLTLASILANNIKGFFTYSKTCVNSSEVPLPLASNLLPSHSSENTFGPGARGSADTKPTVNSRGSNFKIRRLGKEATEETDIYADGVDSEASTADLASLCLYYGCLTKNVFSPMLEDKNGNFNVVLLRTLSNNGVIDCFIEALETTIIVLQTSIEALGTFEAGQEEQPRLDRTGRCALYVLPTLFALLRKLVNRELLNKSISFPPSTSSTTQLLIDEGGPYQTHDLLFKLINSVCMKIIPLFRSCRLSRFPSDIQYDWFVSIGELMNNLANPLPPPKEIPVAVSHKSGAVGGPTPSPTLFRRPLADPDPGNSSSSSDLFLSALRGNRGSIARSQGQNDLLSMMNYFVNNNRSARAASSNSTSSFTNSSQAQMQSPFLSAFSTSEEALHQVTTLSELPTTLPEVQPTSISEQGPQQLLESDTVLNNDTNDDDVDEDQEALAIQMAIQMSLGEIDSEPPPAPIISSAIESPALPPRSPITIDTLLPNFVSDLENMTASGGVGATALINENEEMTASDQRAESSEAIPPRSIVSAPPSLFGGAKSEGEKSSLPVMTNDKAGSDPSSKSDPEYSIHSGKLAAALNDICGAVVENVFCVCEHYDDILHFNAKDSYLLISYLREFLLKTPVKESSPKKATESSKLSLSTSIGLG